MSNRPSTYSKHVLRLPPAYADIQALHRLVQKMRIDDALVKRGWRLERLYLDEGLPHFRLYQCGDLVGVVDIRSDAKLPTAQRELADYLYAIGYRPCNCVLIVGGATTDLGAKKRDLPHLFVV